MTREEVYKRLNNVCDSFEHINLVVAIQEEFDFKIPVGKVVTMKNVGEMVDIILEMGKIR